MTDGWTRQNDICQECFNEITDRQSKKYVILKYCKDCKRKHKKQRVHRWYRKSNPKPEFKWEKVLEILKKGPRKFDYLERKVGLRHHNLRCVVWFLRKKGYDIFSSKGSYFLVSET